MSVGAIRDVLLLLSKERVTERAFAICSINFSPENLFVWTSSSRPLLRPKEAPATTSKTWSRAPTVLTNRSNSKIEHSHNNHSKVLLVLSQNNRNLNNLFCSTKTIAKTNILTALSIRSNNSRKRKTGWWSSEGQIRDNGKLSVWGLRRS